MSDSPFHDDDDVINKPTHYNQGNIEVSDFILEYNPKYEFPHMLVSTIIEGAHQQRYFAEHLPALTDVEKGQNNIIRFYTNLIISTLK